MTKNEFLKLLKEDKLLDNPKDLVAYRLPLVQYYLKHYSNNSIMINGQIFNFKDNIAIFENT